MAARLQAIFYQIAGIHPNSAVIDSIVTSLLCAGLSARTAYNVDLKANGTELTPSIAKAVLDRIIDIIQTSKDCIGPQFREAHKKAAEGTQMIEGLIKAHPALFTTIVALGVVAIMYPALIKALGFRLIGVAPESFAAAWQASYGATVPAESLFSYFQYLGATMIV
ncbi:hypothetical protein OPT61_g1440 [Boeremia exigua]|uniref:Uncharacterized protein n=1 Tax=Boeremia exigua TaxID=749465 RepID=A0ACC2IQ46_9PLEO|nr:hypothetical protein OPT61_g1440 [Boeremia exigua]